MAIEQGEVYLLPHPWDSKVEKHPFIVLSVREANDYERTFIAVMITSANNADDFSFQLTNDMFSKPLKKVNSHVRMHLLTLCLDEDKVGGALNKMKPHYFKQLMKSIGDLIFNYDFSPLP